MTGNLYATREDAITDVRAYIAYYNSLSTFLHKATKW
ncbi:hypothetical protein MO867_20725 [Microbulbifer sp. OS29]|uniref:Uncharacterized protein n=1 Tax=Microbulbifer okhotskensis TaxID=2926617 RepID=A0A9X2ESQ1_9GAMM|nr:hypothetical protein [Microbulbifer okhotskensis]